MLNKIKKANKTQKIIFTIWFILSIFSGYFLNISGSYTTEPFEAIIYSFISVPIMMIILGIPAFILFKIWGEAEIKQVKQPKKSKLPLLLLTTVIIFTAIAIILFWVVQSRN